MIATHTEQRAGRLLWTGIVAAPLAVALFAWLAGRVAAGAPIWFDAGIRDFVHRHATPALTSLMRFVTALGEQGPLVSLSALAVAALLAARWRRAAGSFVVTMVGAFLLDTALKLLFHRPRPAAFFATPEPASYSFPSGHALFSICLWGALAAVVTARVRSLAACIAIWAVAGAAMCLLGLSRIYLGVHYPSDVLAGYAAAVVWVTVVASVDRLLQRRARRAMVVVRKAG
ncbi:MAG: phosphatase PAP2 family protein [Bryobacteraceae bacterium]|jgi:undecaprenyl-diphosphatase